MGAAVAEVGELARGTGSIICRSAWQSYVGLRSLPPGMLGDTPHALRSPGEKRTVYPRSRRLLPGPIRGYVLDVASCWADTSLWSPGRPTVEVVLRRPDAPIPPSSELYTRVGLGIDTSGNALCDGSHEYTRPFGSIQGRRTRVGGLEAYPSAADLRARYASAYSGALVATSTLAATLSASFAIEIPAVREITPMLEAWQEQALGSVEVHGPLQQFLPRDGDSGQK